jgi:hypothetical protein
MHGGSGGGGASGAWTREAAALCAALREDAPLPADALRKLLRGLVAEPPQAVWHPTGFLVLTLLRTPDGALRLHLWPPGMRELGRPCWPVHDHVWDLRAQVLHGEVETRAYEVSDDARGDAVLYAVGYGEGRSSCMRRSERRVSVRARIPRRVAAGERYEVAAGEFHASTVTVDRFAVTLAATRATAQPWPWVVGETGSPEVIAVERSIADPARVQDLLQRSVPTP